MKMTDEMYKGLLKSVTTLKVGKNGDFYFQLEKNKGTAYGTDAFLFVSFDDNTLRNIEIAVGVNRDTYELSEGQAQEFYKALNERAVKTLEEAIGEFIS